MIPLTILYRLIKCIICSIFKKKYHIIIYPLFSYTTYRLNGAKIDFLLPARYLKSSIIQTLRKREKYDFNVSNENAIIFNDYSGTNNSRLNYVKTIDKNNTYKIITRKKTFINGFFNKLVTIIICTIIMIMVYPFFLFPYKKNKNELALMINLFSEWVSIVSFLKVKKWKHIYDFQSFEHDANFITYLTKQLNINTFKFPPSVPMDKFYKHVYTHTFCTTLHHHIYDIDKFKENWIYDNVENWPLEKFQICLPYIKTKEIKYKYDLGYISSGSYIRSKQKHVYDELWEIEKEALFYLKNYLENQKQLNLLISLHPIEKNNEKIFLEMRTYYKKISNGLKLSISEPNKTTQECFSKVNLSISVRSQASYQRLFCGYKSIFYNSSIKDKEVIKDPNLSKIIASNYETLEKKINRSLNLCEKDFFKHYKIHNYRYDSVQNIKIHNLS